MNLTTQDLLTLIAALTAERYSLQARLDAALAANSQEPLVYSGGGNTVVIPLETGD